MKKTILFVVLGILLASTAYLLVPYPKPDRTSKPSSPLVEATTTPSASPDQATNNPTPPEPILLAQTAPDYPASTPAPRDPTPSTTTPTIPANSSAITTADEAAAFFASAKTPAELLERADLSNPIVREFVVARMSEMEESRLESVTEKANLLGIPLRIDGPGNKVSILHDFDGDRPIYRTTQNTNAAISSGANLLYPAPYGLNGSGVKVGVWDAGSVRNTHREFNTSRVVKRNNDAPLDDHGTHVAGTIGANGTTPNAKGMAPLVAIDSYDWNSDYTEMTAAGAATSSDTTRIAISNHSYGYNAVSTDMGR
jgi:hypothetical protein